MTWRGRLVAATAGLTLGTLGLAFIILYSVIRYSASTELDRALVAEARQEAAQAQAGGGRRLVIDLEPGPDFDDLADLTKYAALVGPGGQVLAASASFGGRPLPEALVNLPAGPPVPIQLGREQLRAVRVPLGNNSPNFLVLAAPATEIEHESRLLAQVLLAILLAAVLWSALLASAIMRRLTRDHQLVLSVVHRVANGDLAARVGAVVADSETRRLAQEIDDMVERLATLVSSQQVFIAHAAHELRSPLTTLYGELSMALRREREASDYRATIEDALVETRRLNVLAEDLLALARLGAGREVPMQPLELIKVLEAAQASANWLLEDREIAFAVAGPAIQLTGHPMDLERLFRNLIENAARHAPVGGRVDLQVTPGTHQAVEAVFVDVRDNGPGVHPDDAERIFEPFYRSSVDRAASATGSGLGLTIAREIAKQHGGELFLQPSPSGAWFRVTLAVSPGPRDSLSA